MEEVFPVLAGIALGFATFTLRSTWLTVAVIGTRLSKAYPAENAASQERIWREHLLLTLFVKARPCSGRTFRSEIG